MLVPAVRHLIVLQGGMGRKKLKDVLAHLAAVPEDEDRVVLATGRCIGEGFDDARLDTLFLTLSVSWRGTIAQYAGRLHRLHDRKREVRVYDYADLDVPMLARMFDRRCRGYEAIGYTVQLPASAVPGWPASVALPVDPLWKQNYAASVRRLIRDGVESPLAALFLDATRPTDRPEEVPRAPRMAQERLPDRTEGMAQDRPVSTNAEGADRARSASEAFLYRRLETMPRTAGRFQLIPLCNQDGTLKTLFM